MIEQHQTTMFDHHIDNKKQRTAKKPEKKQQEPPKESVYAEKVMKLGDEYRYRELEVNASLIIGSGPEGWRAYAALLSGKHVESEEIQKAIVRHLKEIERAVRMKELEEAMEVSS